MTSLASSFSIGSILLQVMRTTIKSQMGLKLCKTGLETEELATLDCLENPHRIVMGEML